MYIFQAQTSPEALALRDYQSRRQGFGSGLTLNGSGSDLSGQIGSESMIVSIPDPGQKPDPDPRSKPIFLENSSSIFVDF